MFISSLIKEIVIMTLDIYKCKDNYLLE